MANDGNSKRQQSPSTSLSLLASLRLRDKSAWQTLVHLYGPLVYEWCRRRGLTPDASEVIGQEVFMAVFTSLETFRKSDANGTFRGWLRQITFHKCADYVDGVVRQPKVIGGSDWNTRINEVASEEPDDAEQASNEVRFLFNRAIDLIRGEFTETNLKVFLEVTANGRPPKDVAAEFGLSINSVYLIKSRILKRLKEWFDEVLPELEEMSSDDDLGAESFVTQ